MQKKTLSISIGIVISLLLAINVFTYVSLTRKPKLYDLTVITEDLILEDFNIVAFNKYLYIDKGSYLEKKETSKSISGVNINASINDNPIDIVLSKDFIGERYYLSNNKFINYKIDKDAMLKISIKYIIDGVQKEFHDNIKIIEHRAKDI